MPTEELRGMVLLYKRDRRKRETLHLLKIYHEVYTVF